MARKLPKLKTYIFDANLGTNTKYIRARTRADAYRQLGYLRHEYHLAIVDTGRRYKDVSAEWR